MITTIVLWDLIFRKNWRVDLTYSEILICRTLFKKMGSKVSFPCKKFEAQFLCFREKEIGRSLSEKRTARLVLHMRVHIFKRNSSNFLNENLNIFRLSIFPKEIHLQFFTKTQQLSISSFLKMKSILFFLMKT